MLPEGQQQGKKICCCPSGNNVGVIAYPRALPWAVAIFALWAKKET